MILLLAFASLSVVAIAATVTALRRDGYRAQPVRPSRIPDRNPAEPRRPSAPRRHDRTATLRPSSAR